MIDSVFPDEFGVSALPGGQGADIYSILENEYTLTCFVELLYLNHSGLNHFGLNHFGLNYFRPIR